MHFEILVEDTSGKRALDILVPKIVDDQHTFRVHAYKGVGRIPRGLTGGTEATKRLLLDQLPRLLRGYGKTFAGYGASYRAVVIVVCDLDDRCRRTFRQELLGVLEHCNPRPEKSTWAERIVPELDVEKNASPSFRYFREKLRELTSERRSGDGNLGAQGNLAGEGCPA